MAKGLATHRKVKAPTENLVVIPNMHEAIISMQDFDQVQSLLRTGKHFDKSRRPLEGKIKCGVCGHAMPLRAAKQPYFTCGTKWYTSDYRCSDTHYPQETIYNMLLLALKKQIQAMVQIEAIVKAKAEKEKGGARECKIHINELELALAKCKAAVRENFEQYAKGDLSESDFVKLQNDGKQRQADIEAELLSLRDRMLACDQENNKIAGLIKKPLLYRQRD